MCESRQVLHSGAWETFQLFIASIRKAPFITDCRKSCHQSQTCRFCKILPSSILTSSSGILCSLIFDNKKKLALSSLEGLAAIFWQGKKFSPYWIPLQKLNVELQSTVGSMRKRAVTPVGGRNGLQQPIASPPGSCLLLLQSVRLKSQIGSQRGTEVPWGIW